MLFIFEQLENEQQFPLKPHLAIISLLSLTSNPIIGSLLSVNSVSHQLIPFPQNNTSNE